MLSSKKLQQTCFVGNHKSACLNIILNYYIAFLAGGLRTFIYSHSRIHIIFYAHRRVCYLLHSCAARIQIECRSAELAIHTHDTHTSRNKYKNNNNNKRVCSVNINAVNVVVFIENSAGVCTKDGCEGTWERVDHPYDVG